MTKIFPRYLVLLVALVLTACGTMQRIVPDTATTPAEQVKLQTMEVVAQSERALLQAWTALGEQARAGVLFKNEVQAIEAQLDRAGALLDDAHQALKNGLWDLASGKAGDSDKLADAIQAQLGKYLKERRKPQGAKP